MCLQRQAGGCTVGELLVAGQMHTGTNAHTHTKHAHTHTEPAAHRRQRNLEAAFHCQGMHVRRVQAASRCADSIHATHEGRMLRLKLRRALGHLAGDGEQRQV